MTRKYDFSAFEARAKKIAERLTRDTSEEGVSSDFDKFAEASFSLSDRESKDDILALKSSVKEEKADTAPDKEENVVTSPPKMTTEVPIKETVIARSSAPKVTAPKVTMKPVSEKTENVEKAEKMADSVSSSSVSQPVVAVSSSAAPLGEKAESSAQTSTKAETLPSSPASGNLFDKVKRDSSQEEKGFGLEDLGTKIDELAETLTESGEGLGDRQTQAALNAQISDIYLLLEKAEDRFSRIESVEDKLLSVMDLVQQSEVTILEKASNRAAQIAREEADNSAQKISASVNVDGLREEMRRDVKEMLAEAAREQEARLSEVRSDMKEVYGNVSRLLERVDIIELAQLVPERVAERSVPEPKPRKQRQQDHSMFASLGQAREEVAAASTSQPQEPYSPTYEPSGEQSQTPPAQKQHKAEVFSQSPAQMPTATPVQMDRSGPDAVADIPGYAMAPQVSLGYAEDVTQKKQAGHEEVIPDIVMNGLEQAASEHYQVSAMQQHKAEASLQAEPVMGQNGEEAYAPDFQVKVEDGLGVQQNPETVQHPFSPVSAENTTFNTDGHNRVFDDPAMPEKSPANGVNEFISAARAASLNEGQGTGHQLKETQNNDYIASAQRANIAAAVRGYIPEASGQDGAGKDKKAHRLQRQRDLEKFRQARAGKGARSILPVAVFIAVCVGSLLTVKAITADNYQTIAAIMGKTVPQTQVASVPGMDTAPEVTASITKEKKPETSKRVAPRPEKTSARKVPVTQQGAPKAENEEDFFAGGSNAPFSPQPFNPMAGETAQPARTASLSAQPLDGGAAARRHQGSRGSLIKNMPPVRIGPLALRHAAASGKRIAQFEVATRFQSGQGVSVNKKEAFRWMSRSAAGGFVPAQYRVGTFYERGVGVKKDMVKAKNWYRKAAQAGNVKAMHNLGVLYAGQKEPDYALAADWFMNAAMRGLKDSQFNLAILYENGLGVDKSTVEAYKWYERAAKAGDKSAKRLARKLARKISKANLKKARREVANWKKLPINKTANLKAGERVNWQAEIKI